MLGCCFIGTFTKFSIFTIKKCSNICPIRPRYQKRAQSFKESTRKEKSKEIDEQADLLFNLLLDGSIGAAVPQSVSEGGRIHFSLILMFLCVLIVFHLMVISWQGHKMYISHFIAAVVPGTSDVTQVIIDDLTPPFLYLLKIY